MYLLFWIHLGTASILFNMKMYIYEFFKQQRSITTGKNRGSQVWSWKIVVLYTYSKWAFCISPLSVFYAKLFV